MLSVMSPMGCYARKPAYRMASTGGNFNWSERGASATAQRVGRDEVLGGCSNSMQPPPALHDDLIGG
jgi:hypothetical protein